MVEVEVVDVVVDDEVVEVDVVEMVVEVEVTGTPKTASIVALPDRVIVVFCESLDATVTLPCAVQFLKT